MKDSLYRVSFKCLIQDEKGHVLAVKEMGRGSWDLPGGGIDHGETVQEAIARELKEEVGYEGDFSYSVLHVQDPAKLKTRDVWAMRIIVKVVPQSLGFRVGDEADEVRFIDPATFEESVHEWERRIYEYAQLTL